MANTKISQLPEWTGTAADLRWFVMNNSGETETYKYSGYTSPFKRVDSNNTNNIYDTNVMGGTYNAILGGGDNNSIPSGTYNIIVGAISSTISDSQYSFIQSRNSSINSGQQAVIIGGHAHSIAGGGEVGIFAGYGNSMVGGQDSAIVGGRSNSINMGYACCGGNSIFGGDSNSINNTPGLKNGIMGGYANNIQSSSTNSQIIGGESNTISGKTNVAMVACSGRTAAASATTYVENLHTFRTPSTEVQPVSSGTTFTCNLENGAKSQFYLTGTSTINITNVRDGASFMIKTQADGNHTITWTATGGYTFLFEGGIKDPGNNVTDIFVFEVFGSVIYGNRRHNYS
jgi:hypothetical protein